MDETCQCCCCCYLSFCNILTLGELSPRSKSKSPRKVDLLSSEKIAAEVIPQTVFAHSHKTKENGFFFGRDKVAILSLAHLTFFIGFLLYFFTHGQLRVLKLWVLKKIMNKFRISVPFKPKTKNCSRPATDAKASCCCKYYT